MENLIFIPQCEGLITEESFLEALKNVGRVMLTNSRNSAIVSGLTAYRRITRKKADVVVCTAEEDGSYFYIADNREYIIRVLN